MVDFLNLSDIVGRASRIAIKADTNKDSKLDKNEISVFLQDCQKAGIDVKKEAWYKKAASFIDKHLPAPLSRNRKVQIPEERYVAPNDKIPKPPRPLQLRSETVHVSKTNDKANQKQVPIKDLVMQEAKSRNTKLTAQEAAEWARLIENAANEYDMPAELITEIIGRECHFDDPTSMANGSGCMQVTSDVTDDISMKYRGKTYKKMNPKCYADTIPNEKTYDSQTFRKKCASDRSTCIKAGVLAFNMSYATAVSKKLGISLIAAINGLKDGSIKLSQEDAKDIMIDALERYNTVGTMTTHIYPGGKKKERMPLKKDYALDVTERLDAIGYDYTRAVIPRTP